MGKALTVPKNYPKILPITFWVTGITRLPITRAGPYLLEYLIFGRGKNRQMRFSYAEPSDAAAS